MRVLVKFDIQKIQYMNIFEQITGVKAKTCFFYSNAVVFTVPRMLVNRAVGRDAMNIKRLMMRLNKKVKIIATPNSRADMEYFINSVVYPYKIQSLSFEDNILVIHANPRIKAMLIGKGKMKLHELAEVIERSFGIKDVVIR
jgi:NusA-like KH domain protein